MSYIFLWSMKTEKYYEKAGRYITSELNKINDLKLHYNEIHKIHDIDSHEQNLKYYLDKLENRSDWIRGVLILILFVTLMQLVVVIYVAFDQKYLNSSQVSLLATSFILFISNSFYLLWEYRNFQKNKYEALKLFLMVRQHNFKKISDEQEAKLNPKRKYEKNSPMDYIIGNDD
ncbi:hypothetical protein [Acinetobacter haemolyticus]|uniref:hypothetical protein n=1 Tax=Acinetobacter haemolyticus TaxID=29430 RepID=UPI001372D595|nr:hypothetical protein [Acinetobacter haemolyticus]NAS08125.1 hypothetical protein [Acinetobacter haemolyticus]